MLKYEATFNGLQKSMKTAPVIIKLSDKELFMKYRTRLEPSFNVVKAPPATLHIKVQSKFNNSNIFGTIENCSRY